MSCRGVDIEAYGIRHILRTVSPMIIRQWKDVCRELAVPDEDLYEIERGKPWERLSEMAYQGLCVWLDREGKNATKARLIQALRRCELKRAEEAVEGIIIRKPDRSNTTIQRKKSPTKARKSVSSIEDIPKMKPDFPRSAGRRYSKTPASKRQQWNIDPDEIAVEVIASEIVTETPVGDSWMDTYQKMVLHFYTNIVKNEDDHKRALNTLMDFRDVFVKRIMLGSVVVVVGCQSLKGLDKFQDSYTTGQLEIIYQKTLAKKDILSEIGAKELFLEVYIDPSYFEQCRKTLEAKKLSRSKSSRSKRKGSGSEIQNWPEILLTLENEVVTLTTRFQNVLQGKEKLLDCMKRTTVGSKKICSFGNVMSCSSQLKAAYDVEDSALNLLIEFIEVVSVVRQMTERLSKRLKDSPIASRSSESPMSDLELMLNPDFPFKEDTQVVPTDLTISDKRLFLGFLSYIPLLLAGMRKVIKCIKTSVVAP